MKKHLPLSVALTFIACSFLHVTAAHVSPQQALQRLDDARNNPCQGLMKQTRSGMNHTNTIGNLYIFSDSESYMVLPADDNAPAMLAYSANSPFPGEINPELQYWLDMYNREIEWLSVISGSQYNSDHFTVDTRADNGRPARESIAPLTKTKWNQEGPYNELCPKVDGHETVTGCVATAMAQVLKYHSYPAKGHGEHSYYWEPGKQTLSFNYGVTTFDWDAMTDTYDSESTAASKEAVATLMLACGISVDMHYDVGDSGASTIKMGASLIEYFGYDNAIWMPMRDYYGLYEWENMVYSELKEGRPVLYSGAGTSGGHQFICDGYSGDGFFHFNWGWGGMSDGYFLLTALNPADLGVGGGAGGFNSGQQIALGVKPAVSGSEHTYLMYCTNHFLSNQQRVTAGQRLLFKGGFFNYSLSSLPEGSRMGMKIAPVTSSLNGTIQSSKAEEAADDAAVRYVEGFNISGLGCLEGYGEDFIRFPELPDGEYVITPAFYDGSKWHDIPAPVGAIGSCKALVKSKVATLSSPEAASVTVTDIKVPDTIYKNRKFSLEFTVRNEGKSEFYGDLTPVLMNPATREIVAASVYRPADVEAGEIERVTDYRGDFSALKGEDFDPGEYLLLFRDSEGKAVSETVKVTVSADDNSGISQAIDEDAVGLGSSDTVPMIFDLFGRRHNAPLSPGIYIVNGQKILVK